MVVHSCIRVVVPLLTCLKAKSCLVVAVPNHVRLCGNQIGSSLYRTLHAIPKIVHATNRRVACLFA